MNNAAKNIGVQLCLKDSAFKKKKKDSAFISLHMNLPEVRLLGHSVVLFLIF